MASVQPAVVTPEGLLLPVRPPGRPTLVAFVLGTLLLVAVGVTMLVRLFTAGDWRSLLGSLVILAVGALFAAVTVSLARQDRTGGTGLLLGPDGVRLTDREHPVSLPWEGIAAVDESSPLVEESEEKHSRWVAFRLHAEPEPGLQDELRLLSGSPYPSIDGDALVIGPDAALAVCRHYLTHAEDRAELTTPAALERVGRV